VCLFSFPTIFRRFLLVKIEGDVHASKKNKLGMEGERKRSGTAREKGRAQVDSLREWSEFE